MIEGTTGLTEIELLLMRGRPKVKKKKVPEKENFINRVIVISGPTGCGKSALAMDLAKQINGEIISADSMQVYEGMNIGTAKPTLQDMQKVRHHLIDVRPVREIFNVVDFYYEALTCCKEIRKRNHVPIIVGGSGFYLHTLLYGPPEGPPSIPSVREKLEEEMKKKGLDAMYEKLRRQDPKYAETISIHDRHKILRALEIIEISQKPVSEFHWKEKTLSRDPEFRCWFLFRPKEKLYKRIDHRCDEMLKEGFLKEVEQLMSQGLEDNPSASQAIGYRQALEFLKTPEADRDYDAFLKAFKLATHRYAKRQFTWFRREKVFRWLDVDAHDPETALDMIKKDYICSY